MLSSWAKIWDIKPDFNSLEFEGIKNETARNRFFLSAKKWIELTGVHGLVASAGRYGGTYAHQDIAFEFGSWLSPEFKLYLIKEFRRLKDDENRRLSLAVARCRPSRPSAPSACQEQPRKGSNHVWIEFSFPQSASDSVIRATIVA